MASEEQPKKAAKWNEEEVLAFWRENKIFEQTLAKDASRGDFVFYDGPPFATGLPHYGHILASILKDAIPRYKTMRGFRVPRRWGWDCHGLPIENLIEKELTLKTKKDIEDYGIEKFNRAAKESVLTYEHDWREIIPRIGRWVDMEANYKTMDASYTESVWWVFKTLYGKGLIYEGYKPMHICPRCETTLANFEVAQGYKDITDLSVTVKFELVDEPGTFVLAWTTTPWTLPGNVALAVNPEIEYIKLKTKNEKLKTEEFYILAKARIADVLKEEQYEIISELKGTDLIGKKYQPLFDYYAQNSELKNRENGWKIYGADFVTTEDGTGVVHIAPAFGEDDMNLGQKENLPFVQHVGMDGCFKPEVKDFSGMSVKPKSDDEKERLSTDIAVIKYLQEHGQFFGKEKVTHSYPHCWRCDTPLLNYAASSWFVKVTDIKEGPGGLIENNKQIKWVPEHIRDGRFGKWLEGARDWAISRTRFWGAPLPVWRCEQCKKIEVIGAVDDLKKRAARRSGNKYFTMRHGQSENNAANIVNCRLDRNHYKLTDLGRKQVRDYAEKLRAEKINLIVSSDFLRTKETAELVAEVFGIDKSRVIYEPRVREVNLGVFDGKDPKAYHDYFNSPLEKFTRVPPEGENLTALKNRIMEWLYEFDAKYENKNVLIVSHEYPIWMLFAGARGATPQAALAMRDNRADFISNGEVMALDFAPLPHNENYELDLHRPYIDGVGLACAAPVGGQACGGTMRRIPEVFDCWFESGSMPYGSLHYPFENRELFEKRFPAEFIAEGVDQTRGWFYNILALSTALFEKPAFKNVIANGIILAEDGQKMSKRLKNYPDPLEVVNRYGADALRLYLFLSPVVRAESLNFSERGVEEVQKKVILRLLNIVSFYEMYGAGVQLKTKNLKLKTGNVLDLWIIARLNQTIAEVTAGLENYELDRATRPLVDFVDDLSTWYLRRSRERFDVAAPTLRFVLLELAKVFAPLAPFTAERVWQTLGGAGESVHLMEWPKTREFSMEENALIKEMAEVRRIASAGLELRAKHGIKVRQPLASLKLKTKNEKLKTNGGLLQILKDELNVKEIIFSAAIEDEFALDIAITPELKEEGMLRDLIREAQDLRKRAGLTPQNKVKFFVSGDETVLAFIRKYQKELSEAVNTELISFAAAPDNATTKEMSLDGVKILLGI